MGGKFHLTEVIGLRLIGYKYHEGKVKRTLERGLKVPEIVDWEVNGIILLSEIDACRMALVLT